jgi:YidC/Oxa1 family membrane protein insertase
MEQARLLIAIVLSVLVFLLWQVFFVDKEAGQKSAEKVQQPPAKEEPLKAAKPAPEEPKTVEAEKAPEKAEAAEAPVSKPGRIPRTITVDTPYYRVKLSEKGAGFTSFVLKKYRETVQKNSPLQELLPKKDSIETVLTGFIGNSVPNLDNAVFSTNFNGDDTSIKDAAQEIAFYWKSSDGVEVRKTYKFSPDTYLIGLDVAVHNGSDRSIDDQLFLALNGAVPHEKSRYGFEGPSVLLDKKLEQINIKNIAKKNTYAGNVRWVALQDRYFLMSAIPERAGESRVHFNLKGDDLIQAQDVMPQTSIAAGAQHTYHYLLFFGPMSMQVLDAAGHDLGKALNFGWFNFLAKPCVWLMNKLYSVIPNYGVAIIILTILIKVILWPLGSKSYKSMSEMKKIQPLMKEIREKYKNDKKKMNEEVMNLYRTYKINPLGGCLPMLVQLPVFFALYRMLYQAIELRHAPFFLWIDDLSAPDRLFRFDFAIPFMQPPYGIPVLTIIMGATMLLQQKMSPPMGDPTQAKMMMFMPLIFTVIFINFSSGLVLYWLVNNILSISQQYYIQKKFA